MLRLLVPSRPFVSHASSLPVEDVLDELVLDEEVLDELLLDELDELLLDELLDELLLDEPLDELLLDEQPLCFNKNVTLCWFASHGGLLGGGDGVPWLLPPPPWPFPPNAIPGTTNSAVTTTATTTVKYLFLTKTHPLVLQRPRKHARGAVTCRAGQPNLLEPKVPFPPLARLTPLFRKIVL